MKEHICTPNPLMKYQQYLQVPQFLHLLPQTLYCHANSQDDFTTEPLLLLYPCQQSLPKTATTLHAEVVYTPPAGSSAQRAPGGKRLASVVRHSPSPLQPPTPASKAALMQTARPNPLQSNKPGWQSPTI